MKDIVLDTNVLMHCDNPTEIRCENARALVKALVESKTSLCVDEGFSRLEADNRSRIGSEYLEKLKSGSLGNALVARLAQTGRIAFVSTTVTNRIRRIVTRYVTDKSDRVFAKVAANSVERVLVSHDFAAFSNNVRSTLKRDAQITVEAAAESVSRLK